MESPLLDQANSQAIARLAVERGFVPPAQPPGEDAVRVRGRGWKGWLPYSFFLLGLFSLAGMGYGITALADDGWSLADVVQLALLALLVAGVFTQARSILRSTPAGRWLASRFARSPAEPAARAAVVPPLDVVSAEYLATIRPAAAEPMRLRTMARHKGRDAFQRTAFFAVIALSVLAFLGMVFVLAWMVTAAGIDDASVWLTAPFTALSGFGVYQVFRSAGSMAFRGRPFTLVSRAFRDSVRLWGSGSVAAKVALSTTATASIAGAAVVPAIVQRDTRLDMFVIDSATSAVYRIDLATDISAPAQVRGVDALEPVALSANPSPLKAVDGKTVPRGSLLVVLEGAAGRAQAVVAFPPGKPIVMQVARIEPPVPGAAFTAGEGVLYAAQPDGAFWHVDLRTGAATRVGELTVSAGPMAYESDSRTIIMASGDQLVRLEPASGGVLASNPNNLPAGQVACGLADGPGDLFFVSIRGEAEVRAIHLKSRQVELIRPAGDFAAGPCEIAVALGN